MTSSVFQLPLSYLLWHYTVAWGDLLRLYLNLTWFLWNFFSIRILFGTLFSPWHRLRENAKKDIGGLLGSLILNLILRGIGCVARIATILTGLLALALLFLFFLASLSLWLIMPLVLAWLIISGFTGIADFSL